MIGEELEHRERMARKKISVDHAIGSAPLQTPVVDVHVHPSFLRFSETESRAGRAFIA